jgi:hypothetical protein
VCSKSGPAGSRDPAPADLAVRLVSAIDELAAVAADYESGCTQVAERLARAWAMITAADPELASRAARY